MKTCSIIASLFFTGIATAATPIDGWYSSAFGGYTYLPANLNQSNLSPSYTDVGYQSGYDVGFGIGYKNNPLRYEAQLTYLDANVNNFTLNGTVQTTPRGYNNAILGLANVYYDFPVTLPSLQPFLGIGIGYGWIHHTLSSTGPIASSSWAISNSAFTYQATTGVTYQFAENYALDLTYRYVSTQNISTLGDRFQGHLANISVIYRFDENHYK